MGGETLIIDAANHVLGRLACFVAKKALEGNSVIIVNAEKAVISGNKRSTVGEVKRWLQTRTLAAQYKAPTHPRKPHLYVKRAIRGMLPWRKPKGRRAYRKIKVYVGFPAEYANMRLLRVPSADASRLRGPRITVLDLAKEIGGW